MPRDERSSEARTILFVEGMTMAEYRGAEDLSNGDRFSGWTTIEVFRKIDGRGVKRIYVRCMCDCGNERDVLRYHLVSGNSKNCGCVLRSKQTIHGESSSRIQNETSEHRIWCGIKSRCLNEKNTEYHNYGGRGIAICDRWNDSFELFLKDMGRRPSSRHSIDRIDNNSGYSPENCRWATSSQQNRNKRNNRILVVNGESKTMTEWAEIFGIRVGTISERLRRGLSHQESVTKPVRPHNRKNSIRRQLSSR